jgi:hypothetical protein
MGKVLLIEPHKVLQQALALSLFPEHDVRVQESIEATMLASLDIDLLIIDAAALREKGHLTTELQGALAGFNTPTLWIGDGHEAAKIRKLAIIAKPIDPTALQGAVATLLSDGAGNKKKSIELKPENIAAGEQDESGLIDLVEAVDDTPQKAK